MDDQSSKKYFLYGIAFAGLVASVGVGFVLGASYGPDLMTRLTRNAAAGAATPITVADPQAAQIAEQVAPSAGVTLPVTWGGIGKQLVEKGVIDRAQFVSVYNNRLGLGAAELNLLDNNRNGSIVMTPDNAGVILNLLWALGLGNKNSILETGPMVSKQYGGAGNFASTGGWTMAVGKAMDHYSKHVFLRLDKKQQALVERVALNIYRPCCNNPVYFPDCNHGMAMLGLLELMASQGASEAKMYKTALAVNSYWFPDTYLTLAKYEAKQGLAWNNVDPKEMLSAAYSSASGYKAIRARVAPAPSSGGGSCGV